VFEKIQEELNELQQAIEQNDPLHIEEEMGDVFFSLINYARFLNIDADMALERTNRKFITRFQLMEEMANQEGKKLQELNLQEMDAIWNKIKLLQKSQ